MNSQTEKCLIMLVDGCGGKHCLHLCTKSRFSTKQGKLYHIISALEKWRGRWLFICMQLWGF
jgi:ATP/ADP translocase